MNLYHQYILCIFPSLEAHPIRIEDDCTIDLGLFCEKWKQSSYNLFYISPSLIQILPNQGLIQLPIEFTHKIPDYRLQFLPNDTPNYILRIYPKCDFEVNLLPWNLIFDIDCDISLNQIAKIFKKTFCVEANSFEFDFEPQTEFPLDEPIADNRNILKQTKVMMKVNMSKEIADLARKRKNVLREVYTSEENYVKLIRKINSCFPESFFTENNADENAYRKTFRPIFELSQAHDLFLMDLSNVGFDVESSIGQAFLQYCSLFNTTFPHVRNLSNASKELSQVLAKNKIIAKKIKKICQEEFDGRNIESLMTISDQRLPRYQILLDDLLKTTPDCHWDHNNIVRAIEQIRDILNKIENTRNEQEQIDIVTTWQNKIGNSYQIIKNGRKGLFLLENIKINDFKGSLYLFNDSILIHKISAQPAFIEIKIEDAVITYDQTMIINSKFSIPYNERNSKFYEIFIHAKREQILTLCIYGNALAWKRIDANGPVGLSSPTMAYANDSIYLFGGKHDDKTCSNDIWMYHGSRWILLEATNKPPGRFGCTMDPFFNNEKLVIFGGQNGDTCLNDLYIFDTKTLNWEKIEVENPPSPRAGHASAAAENQLVIFGGRNNNNTYFNDLYEYDFSSEKWFRIGEDLSNIPSPRALHTAFWLTDVNGKPYFSIYGGATGHISFDEVWCYSFIDNEWFVLETFGEGPGKRYAHCSAIIGTSLYVIGGTNIYGENLDSYKLSMETIPFTWSKLPQCDNPDSFSFGAIAEIPEFGLALYNKTNGLFKIRLSYLNDSFSCETIEQFKPDFIGMSQPSYNIKTGTMTSVIGQNTYYDFTLGFDISSFNIICKIKNGQPFWRKEYVLEMTGNKSINMSMNRFVLNESEFNDSPHNSGVYSSVSNNNDEIFGTTHKIHNDRKLYTDHSFHGLHPSQNARNVKNDNSSNFNLEEYNSHKKTDFPTIKIRPKTNSDNLFNSTPSSARSSSSNSSIDQTVLKEHPKKRKSGFKLALGLFKKNSDKTDSESSPKNSPRSKKLKKNKKSKSKTEVTVPFDISSKKLQKLQKQQKGSRTTKQSTSSMEEYDVNDSSENGKLYTNKITHYKKDSPIPDNGPMTNPRAFRRATHANSENAQFKKSIFNAKDELVFDKDTTATSDSKKEKLIWSINDTPSDLFEQQNNHNVASMRKLNKASKQNLIDDPFYLFNIKPSSSTSIHEKSQSCFHEQNLSNDDLDNLITLPKDSNFETPSNRNSLF